MRLDHIAFRVKDREKTAKFLQDSFGYTIQTQFPITFNDGSQARCIALQPSEKTEHVQKFSLDFPVQGYYRATYHMAPEIFVSDGDDESIVGKWVKARGGIGGIHHLAYEVDSVEDTMKEWKEKGWAEFASESPLTCEDLTQVFSKPHALTGVIFEFIERKGQHGFCVDNVKDLMESTQDF